MFDFFRFFGYNEKTEGGKETGATARKHRIRTDAAQLIRNIGPMKI